MTILIEANHLVKSFGDTHAVADLSLSVASGEIYGLVGPDGAGKTIPDRFRSRVTISRARLNRHAPRSGIWRSVSLFMKN